MTIDFTGGLSEDREFLFASQPDDPEMRESVNVWIWDDGIEFGMPRVGVEAVADQWDTHDVQVNLALADGRVLNVFAAGNVHDRLGADGRARVLGAGPLSFELIEPFVHWRARIDGTARETSTQAQIDGWTPGQTRGRDGADRARPRHPFRGTAVRAGNAAPGSGPRPRHPGGRRPHGWPPLRATVPGARHAADR